MPSLGGSTCARCEAPTHLTPKLLPCLQPVYAACKRLFSSLPLSARIGQHTLVLHGGLFRRQPQRPSGKNKRKRSILQGANIQGAQCRQACSGAAASVLSMTAAPPQLLSSRAPAFGSTPSLLAWPDSLGPLPRPARLAQGWTTSRWAGWTISGGPPRAAWTPTGWGPRAWQRTCCGATLWGSPGSGPTWRAAWAWCLAQTSPRWGARAAEAAAGAGAQGAAAHRCRLRLPVASGGWRASRLQLLERS